MATSTPQVVLGDADGFLKTPETRLKESLSTRGGLRCDRLVLIQAEEIYKTMLTVLAVKEPSPRGQAGTRDSLGQGDSYTQ